MVRCQRERTAPPSGAVGDNGSLEQRRRLSPWPGVLERGVEVCFAFALEVSGTSKGTTMGKPVALRSAADRTWQVRSPAGFTGVHSTGVVQA